MNLPNYFLADLPPGTALTPAVISDACQTLKKNRENYLATRSTQSLIRIVSGIAKNWLDPDDVFRQETIRHGPAATGFTRETLATGLDLFFEQVTAENLQTLVIQEFGDAQRLDTLSATPSEQKTNRASFVRGPELLAHITGGSIPNPVLTSIIFGLLTRSAQFVKCASGSSFLPRMFAHSIYETEPKLGACLEIAEWKGGNEILENALFSEINTLTATGSDETLETIRRRLPPKVRLIGHGHRVSFAFVTNEVLSGMNPQRIVSRAARDIVAWNQLGCLSPHVIYVETGGKISSEQFAEMLATELDTMEQQQPRGLLSTEEASAIAYRRSFYEVRAAHSLDTKLWSSSGSTAWTVVFENDPRFQMSCLNRFIYVKAVGNLKQALEGADAVRTKISTVGIAATEDRALEIANQLAQWGATRICPLGQMQNPPLLWRHDGHPALGDLVTWTDWEM
ncbi:MAG: acyl-CoA reductase [Verrucomicrobiota bacterium]